jgi:aspartyl-tRNA(Asn)/glutamyl-tRNA(Gln) amidotransferase subunit A
LTVSALRENAGVINRRSFLAAGAAAAVAISGGLPLPVNAAPDPADLSALEALALLRARRLSARELLAACRRRIAAGDAAVQCFVTHTDDLAWSAAAAADGRYAAGRPLPLDGVPVGLKDLYYTRGVRTAAGSRVLADFVPDHDATVWARLRDAGAVLLGKLTTHEFAYGTSTPPTRNPWDLSRHPGGSSGGSAAALAARFLPAATGTDTAGSLRLPAAVTGCVALKPTYGLVSRHGIVPLAWSMDCAGPMARKVGDVAYLLHVIAGHDPLDPTSLPQPAADHPLQAPPDLRGVRLGRPTAFFWEGVDASMAAVCETALRLMRDRGAEIVDLDLPPGLLAAVRGPAAQAALTPAALTILAEAAAYHQQFIRTRAALYSPEILTQIELGQALTAVDYLQAQRVRGVCIRDLGALLADRRIDAVVHPTTTRPPGPQTPSRSVAAGVPFDLTVPWNFLGFPSLSVPAGLDSRHLPVGLLLSGPPLTEARLLGIGLAVEQAVGFAAHRPGGLG